MEHESDQESIQVEKPQLSHHKAVYAVRHHWLTVAFLLGFIVDNITLNRVDQLFDNFLLAMYVILAMGSLLLLYASAAEKIEGQLGVFLKKWSPVMLQYSFGGLLSGMLIFYGRSGSWSESWPYLAIILLAIYGNETLKERASRLIYNLAILFVGLLSYIVLVIPVFTGMMGPWIFVGSGLIAVVIMYWFMRALRLIIPRFLSLHQKAIVFTLGTIYVCLNFLYFANIIPPIPLSLKDVGVFHSVVRFENGDYQLKYEKGEWWQVFKKSDYTYHATSEDNIFCFAKVFAPTRLTTNIYHSWDYYDETEKEWVEYFRLAYPISGGGAGGYRGYTLIQNFIDGKWRCSVETQRGQVLGREVFYIDSNSAPEELQMRIE